MSGAGFDWLLAANVMHRLLSRHLDRAARHGGHRHEWRKIGLRCLLLLVATAGVVAAGWLLQDHIPALEGWIKAQGPWAGLLFVAIFLVGSVLLAPADLFIFIAGALFGFGWGYAYTVIALLIIMPLQFEIGRHLVKAKVEGFMQRHPKFNAIDRAVEKRGLKVAFLLRLGPIPLAPLSYILGVSRIRLRDYLLASVGALGSPLAVVYYGNLAAHLTKLAAGQEHHSAAHYISMIAGAVVAVIATVYITRVARQALREDAAL